MQANGAGKSLLAGTVGGLIGAWAMRRFSSLWRRLGGPSSAPIGQPYSSQEWDSAGGAADWLAEIWLGRPVSGQEKVRATAAVHYLVGGLAGAGYGLGVERCPSLRAGSGAAFGVAFWLLGDELIMPRLGLTKRAAGYPVLMNLHSLAEHLVYGVTAEEIRRALLRR